MNFLNEPCNAKNITQIDSCNCTGCSACANVCSNKCICLRLDEKGFYSPIVDQTACANCGDCINVCQKSIYKSKPIKCFACQSYDDELLKRSTSGAFFPVLCKEVIRINGAVFGAAYNENMEIKHISITRQQDLYRIMGSKYAESYLGDSYIQVGKKLLDGIKVLFSGTPCQIKGLLNYLSSMHIDYKNNLITVDVICYGIPSSQLFKKCIEYYENEFKDNVIDYSFRDKTQFGWSHTTKVEFKNSGAVYSYLPSYDPYYRLWSKTDLCLRDSCYCCDLIGIDRISDFTIGNFWGVESLKNSSVFDIDKGVSMVLINSKNGIAVFEQIKDKLKYVETDLEHCIKFEHGLKNNKVKTTEHDLFCCDVLNNSLEYCLEKYAPLSRKANAILKLPYWLRKLIFYYYKKTHFNYHGVRL